MGINLKGFIRGTFLGAFFLLGYFIFSDVTSNFPIVAVASQVVDGSQSKIEILGFFDTLTSQPKGFHVKEITAFCKSEGVGGKVMFKNGTNEAVTKSAVLFLTYHTPGSAQWISTGDETTVTATVEPWQTAEVWYSLSYTNIPDNANSVRVENKLDTTKSVSFGPCEIVSSPTPTTTSSPTPTSIPTITVTPTVTPTLTPSPSLSPTVTPPVFPSCETKLEIAGDWSHSSYGFHHIPGQEATIEGSDDVFYLSGDNFLQCLCKKDSRDGIQTEWWNAKDLSENTINHYKNEGWFYEQGAAWNLKHVPYLAKNSTYLCASPSPTPTVTPTSTLTVTPSPSISPTMTVTPTVTPTMTATPTVSLTPAPSVTPLPTVSPTPAPSATESPTLTPIPGPESKCFDLEVEPSEGTVPLTVKFTAHANDPATGGKIKEYRFDFGDASGGQPQVWSQTDRTAYHRYELPGTYTPELRIQDNAGNWRGGDDCKATVKVNAAPQVLGVKTPDKLPETGLPAVVTFLLLAAGPVGVVLYRRFKLV